MPAADRLTIAAHADRALPLLVVSYLANDPMSPRGIRTQQLVPALARYGEVEVIAPAAVRPRTGATGASSPARRVAAIAARHLLFDKAEPWSRRRFARWQPVGRGALLVGFPFSPLVASARRLVRHGIAYVVDAGDPWVLTARHPTVHGPAAVRARRAEARLWANARAAIVTTRAQGDALAQRFGHLELLVRPNGAREVAPATTAVAGTPVDGTPLRLVHLGSMYGARVDPRPFLGALAADGQWTGVELHQFGPDWTDALASMPPAVRVVRHELMAWEDVARLAPSFHAVLAIGNRDPSQLPSKVIDYLTLTVPRIAVVEDTAHDAITAYVRDKPGWVIVAGASADAARRVRDHLGRDWSATELACPDSERWPVVADRVAAFVDSCLTPR
jgi:hypothetical protein